MDYTQLAIQTDDVVTEITIRVGVVGSSHAQAQVEAHDSKGQMVAMISRHHVDPASLQQALVALCAEAVRLVELRHSPF